MQPILLLDIISRGDGIVVLANGAGFVGIGTTLPSTKLEVQGTASASYFMASGSVQFGSNVATASYSRFGGTSVTRSWLSSADDLVISDDIYVVGTGSFTNASASFFRGTAFNITGNECSDDGDTLAWNNGTFSCGDDDNSGGSPGNVADGLDIANSGGTYFSIASLQFDASHFTFSNTASDGYVRLDWGDGGPASLSQDETVSGGWIFTNDIVANNSLSTAFAKFSSTSSGRFGLGDTTPEAFFEIASSSGVVASISNIFSINATTTSS